MGFTQRQAAGKFTQVEAEAFIQTLQGTEPDGNSADGPSGSEGRSRTGSPLADANRGLRRVPADRLAVELRGRGWTVIAPDSVTD